mgnify:CR=1 FL=1
MLPSDMFQYFIIIVFVNKEELRSALKCSLTNLPLKNYKICLSFLFSDNHPAAFSFPQFFDLQFFEFPVLILKILDFAIFEFFHF